MSTGTDREAPTPPTDLKLFLGAGNLAPLGRGGSGALVLKHSRGDTRTFVKYVPHCADALEGHESRALLAKAAQVRLIHDTAPALRVAVPIVAVTELASGYVLTSPLVSGRSPLEALLAGDVEAFGTSLQRLLSAIGDSGYCCRSSVGDNTMDPYVGRVQRRLEYFGDHVNDVCPSELDIPTRSELLEIADIVARVAQERALLPARLYFPVHGDLNLFNVIQSYENNNLVMVDQRGVLMDWDPLYDIGKMLITLWIQAGLEKGLYRVTKSDRGGSAGVDITCRQRDASLLWLGIDKLRVAISNWSFGGELEAQTTKRWLRVLFAAAVHAVSEAACRISVAKSVLCASPVHEVRKSLAYLDFGQSLLQGLERRDEPELPRPKAVS